MTTIFSYPTPAKKKLTPPGGETFCFIITLSAKSLQAYINIFADFFQMTVNRAKNNSNFHIWEEKFENKKADARDFSQASAFMTLIYGFIHQPFAKITFSSIIFKASCSKQYASYRFSLASSASALMRACAALFLSRGIGIVSMCIFSICLTTAP